jgi:hypothetical protein
MLDGNLGQAAIDFRLVKRIDGLEGQLEMCSDTVSGAAAASIIYFAGY